MDVADIADVVENGSIGGVATRYRPPPRAPDSRQAAWRRTALLGAAILIATLATRFQQFGNPIVHIDEQFYLLVGDRMLSGAIPYVDIWDRKPIGLFLIYAAIRMLGGSGILQYQLVAAGFAAMTALVVERIASRFAGRRGATLAALLYLLWIPLLTGQGGQSPVFYNLFVAVAALAVLTIADRRSSPARILALGLAAMLAIGVAIQIKYTALFEGFYFGLALIWLGWRSAMPRALLALAIPAWVAAAMLPTLAAATVYWALGHFDAFWFANFVSIFQRNSLGKELYRNAATLGLYVAPLLIVAASGARMRWRQGPGGFAAGFVTLWLIVAVGSIVAFGYYFDHYGLPLVVPAAASAATFLEHPRRRRWAIAILSGALLACLLLPTFNQRRRGSPAQFARLAQTVRPYAPRGLLVWNDMPALYYVLHVPLRTRYPFPTHLREANERGAIGADQTGELGRLLDLHPAVVVRDRGRAFGRVTDTTAYLLLRLARDYHEIAAIRVGRRDSLVYVRNGAAPAP